MGDRETACAAGTLRSVCHNMHYRRPRINVEVRDDRAFQVEHEVRLRGQVRQPVAVAGARDAAEGDVAAAVAGDLDPSRSARAEARSIPR